MPLALIRTVAEAEGLSHITLRTYTYHHRMCTQSSPYLHDTKALVVSVLVEAAMVECWDQAPSHSIFASFQVFCLKHSSESVAVCLRVHSEHILSFLVLSNIFGSPSHHHVH